jgi:uncharacterized protein YwgA
MSKITKDRWLAAIIAGHDNRTLYGRTRLQKTIWLLQAVGLPANYDFKIHHYGPYSEGLQADLSVVKAMGLVSEEHKDSRNGKEYSIFKADETAVLDELMAFHEPLERIKEVEDHIVLELAATYGAYRGIGLNHDSAIKELIGKKGSKCTKECVASASKLLCDLKLPWG